MMTSDTHPAQPAVSDRDGPVREAGCAVGCLSAALLFTLFALVILLVGGLYDDHALSFATSSASALRIDVVLAILLLFTLSPSILLGSKAYPFVTRLLRHTHLALLAFITLFSPVCALVLTYIAVVCIWATGMVMASEIRTTTAIAGYQIAFVQEFEVDHTTRALKFYRIDGAVAHQPIYVNSARRCHQLQIQQRGARQYFLCDVTTITAATPYVDQDRMVVDSDGEQGTAAEQRLVQLSYSLPAQ
jgi:hypothetical protein